MTVLHSFRRLSCATAVRVCAGEWGVGKGSRCWEGIGKQRCRDARMTRKNGNRLRLHCFLNVLVLAYSRIAAPPVKPQLAGHKLRNIILRAVLAMQGQSTPVCEYPTRLVPVAVIAPVAKSNNGPERTRSTGNVTRLVAEASPARSLSTLKVVSVGRELAGFPF